MAIPPFSPAPATLNNIAGLKTALRQKSKKVLPSNVAFPAVSSDVPTFTFSGTNPIVTSPLTIQNTDARMTFQGTTKQSHNYFTANGIVNGCNSTWTPPAMCVEFDYYGNNFAIEYQDLNTGVVVGGGITAASLATPIVITTTSAHGLQNGYAVTISGVTGNTAANGQFFAKVTGYSTTTFALYSDAALTQAVAGNGAYVSGGILINVLNAGNFWVWSDDAPTTTYPQCEVGITPTGGTQYLQMQWSVAKLRRIRLYMVGISFYRLYLSETDSLQATPPQEFNFAVIGDSWTESTGSPFYTLGGYAFLLGLEMGCKMPFVCGQGGTGQSNNAGGGGKTIYGSQDRMAAVILGIQGTLPTSGTFYFTYNGVTSATASNYNDTPATLLATVNALVGFTCTGHGVSLTNTAVGNGGGVAFVPPVGQNLFPTSTQAGLGTTSSTLNTGTLVIQPILPNNIDYGLILGSINDGATNVTTLATTMYAALTKYYPNTLWAVAGTQSSSTRSTGNQSATQATNNANIKAAVTAAIAARSNILGFIDMFTVPWLFGTGVIGNPAGDGNDDYALWAGGGPDFIHPSYFGHQIVKRQLASNLAILAGIW